jgi:hypothetical protein
MRNAAPFAFEAAQAGHRPGVADARRAAPPRLFAQRSGSSQGVVPSSRGSSSLYCAMQRPPLSALASNDNDHAHVRAVAILGYN